jgi:hypothetical protein
MCTKWLPNDSNWLPEFLREAPPVRKNLTASCHFLVSVDRRDASPHSHFSFCTQHYLDNATMDDEEINGSLAHQFAASMGMKAVPCNSGWIHEHSHGSISNFMDSNFNPNGMFGRMSTLFCYRIVNFVTASQFLSIFSFYILVVGWYLGLLPVDKRVAVVW